MEGLEISVVKLSEVIKQKNFRLDDEFYKKDYLSFEKKLTKFGFYKIFDLTTQITDFGAFSQNNFITFIDKGVKFLRNQDVKESYFDNSNAIFISNEVYKRLTLHLQENDVVVPRVGTLGNAALITKEMLPCSANQNLAVLRLNNKINPYIMVMIFVSEIGKKQLNRNSTGNVQQWLNLDAIGNLKVPIFSDDFQSKIESIVKSAHAKLEESKSLYSQAEVLLLGELGLKDWQPQNTLHTTKKFSDFAQSGRLDAEYYQPKYDDLFEKLSKVECKTIKEIQIINYRGFQPEYVENGKIDVINSKHILEDGLDYDNFEKTDELSFNNAVRAHVKYGDVLTYTTGANIGRTQVYLSEKKAMASNHVNMLRVKDVNPIYLALVLNSKIGRLQTEKSCTGSAQVELYPDDLASFVIPILPESIQTKIASLIQQSFECKAQSKQLLEDAKRMVEEEIEK